MRCASPHRITTALYRHTWRWSSGIALTRSCGCATVATVLAYLLARREGAEREQLRDWYRAVPAKSGAKRGRKRRTLDVTTCFAPLLRWVVAWWDPACPQLALVPCSSPLHCPSAGDEGQRGTGTIYASCSGVIGLSVRRGEAAASHCSQAKLCHGWMFKVSG